MIPTLRRAAVALLLLGLVLTGLASPATAALSAAPVSLKVQGIERPLDLDVAPDFGWHVTVARQTAYEVVVASTPQKAAAGDGDVWSTGKVASSRQTDVPYGGPDLAASERYSWAVRTWDGDGQVSAWSEVGTFGTGPGAQWADSRPIWAPVSQENWTDYTFETDAIIDQNAASLTFRTTSTSAFQLWQFRSDTNSLKTHDNLVLREDVPLGPKGITLTNGQKFRIKIVVQGSTATTFINDVEVNRSENLANAAGGFGFRTGSSERARFDNLSVTAEDGTTLYANTFGGPAPELPSLAVTNGELVVGTSKNEVLPGAYSNYSLRATLTIDEVAVGLRFRGVDEQNAYMWQLRADNRLVPHRQVNGTFTEIKSVALPAGTLAAGKTVPVRIDVVGTEIKTYVGGALVDTTVDGTFRRGSVGLRQGRTESATIDDLSVTELGSGTTAGRTLVDTTFAAGDRTFACGVVSGGALKVGYSDVCLQSGLSANWAFLRSDVDLPAGKEVAWATVYATGADHRPAKQYVYKLWVNGEFVGLGPTHAIANEVRYDGFDVTELLRSGEANAIGALAYTTRDQRFQAELRVEYTDGSQDVFGTGPSWSALNGSDVFPSAGSIGTSFYVAPKENLDSRAYPHGFDAPGFDDAAWAAPRVKAPFGTLAATPTDKVEEQLHEPVRIVDKGNGNYFIDFGRTWIGGVQYDVTGQEGQRVDLRFGETTSAPDTVRFAMNTGNTYQDVVTLEDGAQQLETWGMRVFRYAEVVGAPEPITKDNFQALALVYPFDRETASFSSSDDNLNQVYQLSKNSIEALNVNFYTDSYSRERINYEADGYLQLQSSLYLMEDLSLGKYSMNYFKSNRTWPTEWPITVIMAVHDAWRQTGDVQQVEEYFDNLKTKLPLAWIDPTTGLVRKGSGSNGCNSQTDCDIVDWPTSQRDGYQFRTYNTVVNAYAYRAMRNLASMAEAIGRTEDATAYTERADRLRAAMNERLLDPATGRYDDGMNDAGQLTGHYSVHASAFALAFGVPQEADATKVADFVDSRGMACSVYCAAFLVKGLYNGGNGQAALDRLTDEGTSSWMNMIRLGAGATMEAWDPSQKSNLTYSHPWAASPAFTIPSGLFGIEPVKVGYETFEVRPQPGDLESADISVPTVRGTITAAFEQDDQGRLALDVTVPGTSEASVNVPLPADVDDAFVPRHPRQATYEGRTTRAGTTYATFTVGTGSWSFGPGSQVVGSVSAEVSDAGQDGWYGQGATLTLTSQANGDAVTEYRVGDGAWTTYSTPVELAAGTYAVAYRLRSGEDVLDEGSLDVKVDLVAPVVAHEVQGRTVTLGAFDLGGSGLASVEYRLDDDEAWTTYAQPFTLDDDGHVVHYRGTDVAGNSSATASFEVAPVYLAGDVTASVSRAGLDGWHGRGATLTLSAADDALVERFEYRLGDGAWTTWTAPVALPSGTTVVGYRAVGSNGAVGTAAELTVKVDDVAPTSSATRDGRTVTITGDDTGGSRVAALQYRVDDGEWTAYTGPVVLDADAHVVAHRAVDFALNVGEVGTLDVPAAPVGPLPAPVATRDAAVSGTATVGKTLTLRPPTWDLNQVDTAVQWLRDGTPIPGATRNAYTLAEADGGRRISVQVTATKVGHATGTSTSAPTAKVAKAAAKVTGVLKPSLVTSGSTTALTAAVRATGASPTGLVDVYYRGKRVRTGMVLVDGKVRTTFRPTVVGRHAVRIVYRGSNGVTTGETTLHLRVR